MNGDCCVVKFLHSHVDGEHLMHLQIETSIFKFLWPFGIVWKRPQKDG